MPLQQVAPYLNFQGKCREAMTFYASLLGGTIEAMMTGEGTPMEKDWPKDMVIHACLKVGTFRIMASDAPAEYFAKAQGLEVSLHFDDPVEGQRIFDALAQGGTVKMAYQPTFWAKGFGSCVDKFGTPWMINVS